ncbi:MAG: NYN domain-containing protein [Deltaproteobacteria bacterium]|nr:NYN domain-containing protein [Candidatus Zymogenaceae bacterium]
MRTTKKNVAILWDIENVTPSKDSLFVDGLLDYAKQIGNISSALAIGNWTATLTNNLAVNISEKGFELIHMPQPDEKTKRKKNSADFALIAKTMEMIFQYPHLQTYILLTGDIDFRPLLQTLKRHGKRIIVICDSNTASEDLLEFADEYADYRALIPDDTSTDASEQPETTKGLKKEEAFPLLTEAIQEMTKKKKIPTPGSVKVRMQLLNENFSGTINGCATWQEFINAAVKQDIIAVTETDHGITLSIPSNNKHRKSQSDMPYIINALLDAIQGVSPSKKWVRFSQAGEALMEKGVNIKAHNYTKFKQLILDAEKRNLVETRQDKMVWYVRRK